MTFHIRISTYLKQTAWSYEVMGYIYIYIYIVRYVLKNVHYILTVFCKLKCLKFRNIKHLINANKIQRQKKKKIPLLWYTVNNKQNPNSNSC